MPDGSAPAVLRVAVAGAGPSGLYATDALVHQDRVPVRVDVLDRLPTPYGLVRYGVAPDHQKIKSIAATLQKVFDHPAVRFLGGVGIGEGVSHDDLLACYDAVVWATGASVDRRLGIPGEDLPGSHPATGFVSWYSGHPDAVQPFALDTEPVESVAVLGAGNVAVDVVRVLAKTAEDLRGTDLPEPVLAALAASRVRDIHLVGRRGPQHAKFTTKELRELGELSAASVRVDPADLDGAVDAGDRRVRQNLEVLRRWAAAEPGAAPRRIHLHFWRRPVAVLGHARVEGLRLERMALAGEDLVVGTGETEVLPVGLVLRAVGYRSVALHGVPFDEAGGVVLNDHGRVVSAEGEVVPGEYVAGWLKRGPTGVIGTNKADAHETVRALLDDAGRPDHRRTSADQDLLGLLRARGMRVVDYGGWLAIDTAEVALGASLDRPRVKIADWATLRDLGSPSPD